MRRSHDAHVCAHISPLTTLSPSTHPLCYPLLSRLVEPYITAGSINAVIREVVYNEIDGLSYIGTVAEPFVLGYSRYMTSVEFLEYARVGMKMAVCVCVFVCVCVCVWVRCGELGAVAMLSPLINVARSTHVTGSLCYSSAGTG